MLKTISPIDNSIYFETAYATEKSIADALIKAKKAQHQWQQVPVSERAIICRKAIEFFNQHQAEIALELTWQMGRPLTQTPGEIAGLTERAHYMIDIARDALADFNLVPKNNFTRFIRREPWGVVFTIAPWNYPYLTTVNTVIPALIAGNSVILKPSSQTPLTAERFAKAFSYAGLPDGLFQALFLTHENTEAILASSDIDYVAFTGSVSGGQRIQQAASKQFHSIGLELGGKDPAYVCADANLSATVENLVDGAFFNSGQSCCGIERIYVHQSIYNDFLAQYIEQTQQYRLGNPLDEKTNLGPVVRTNAADFIQAQLDEAIAQGAVAHIDTKAMASNLSHPYMAPQVLTNVNHDMRFMMEETFGPAVGIMPVKDDEEAITLMNDSPYGLTASIWTNDEERALTIGPRIATGTWFMNRCDYLDPALAWTGVKHTGRGVTLSVLGYEHLTRVKSYHLRKTL